MHRDAMVWLWGIGCLSLPHSRHMELTQKPRRGSADVRGGAGARAFYCSCPPNLQQVKLEKRSKKHPSLTPMNTSVGEIHQLMV